jgi:hypothetical protein
MMEPTLSAAVAVMGGANIALRTMVQLATKDLFDGNSKRKTQSISSLRHLKRKRMSDEILPFFYSILECELLFYQVHVEKAGEKKKFGSDYGLYYIKPRSVHWWEQYSSVVMLEDPDRFRQFFRLSVPTFQYICCLVHEEMQRNPPLGLIQITGRLMDVSKQMAIALRRLATGDTHLSVSELFGVADSTSVKICKRFIKALLNAAIPLHLK